MRTHATTGLVLALVALLIGLPLLPTSLLPQQAAAAWGQSLQQKVNKMRAKKREKLRAANTITGNIVRNQRRLEGAQRSLSSEQQKLEYTRSALLQLTEKMDRTLGETTRLSKEASKLLRNVYMGGRISMLEMLLEAPSISTFVDRAYYKRRIIEHQKAVLSELQKKAVELHLQRKELMRKRQEIAASIQNIESYRGQISQRIRADHILKQKYLTDASFYARAEQSLMAESNRISRQLAGRGSSAVAQSRGSGIFSWPIIGKLMSRFGRRFHPIHKRSAMHTGLDIAASYGTPVKAADGGQVIYAGWRGGYGKTVMVDHGNRNGKNLVTLYGHMSRIAVSNGSAVSKGQVVGYEGSTGYSTGPHLHFEVRENGAPVNPLNYLR